MWSVRSVVRWAAIGIALTTGGTREAGATEPMPERASRLDAPGRNTASEDSAESLVLNPANLGFLPAAELRWTGVRCPDTQKVNCGHAFDLASPLLFGFSTGLRVDYVIPPSPSGFPFNGADYAWITWGLAYRLSDSFSVGTSLQRSYSANAFTDGMFGISAAVSFRPDPHFGLALVAHDFNGPRESPLGPGGSAILDRSFVLSAAFRPTGRRGLELGLDVACLDDVTPGDHCANGGGTYEPRATLGVDIPGVGRARGDVQVVHLGNDAQRGVVATAGLELALGGLFRGLSAGGGALFGGGLGGSTNVGEYLTASISAYSSPDTYKLKHAVAFRIESTPSIRRHTALLRKLWKVADDPDVAGVALILRAEPADSYAHAEELADAIRVLRARKKKVLCSWEDAGAKALYVCANADRIVVNPAGGLRYAGLRMQYIYLAGLLKKLGINAEFIRISDHKSAPEQFTNEHASDTARADHEDLLREHEEVFTKDVALGRKMSEERVRQATARGPFIASEAREAGLLDGTAFDDELDRAMRELLGGKTDHNPGVAKSDFDSISVEKYADETVAPTMFGNPPKIAILYIEGDMVDGRSSHIPLVDLDFTGSYSVVDTIKAVRDDASIKSVVLRIESPGGSSMAADVIWRAVEQLAQKKPVVVSMGSVAASGGYYVASPARTIYALPLTITGSIGIFYGKADVSGLLQKIGVTVDTYRTSPRADAESIFRPFTEDEQKALSLKIHQFYDTFLDRVSRGRHMSKEEVDRVGEGRVWTGQEALDHHLVDRLGGLREALDEARRVANLPYDAPIVELPKPEMTFLDMALNLVGLGPNTKTVVDGLPVAVKDVARAIAPMIVYAADVPLARMEWVDLGE
jgi:protease-4